MNIKIIYSFLLPAFFISLFSFPSYGQKVAVSGEKISASKINSALLQIGSIQQALLTEAQFQSLNGDCWRLMNGSSVAGTDFGEFTGMTTLPNMVAEGDFLRQASGSRVLGSHEADEFKSHTHATQKQGSGNNGGLWHPQFPGAFAGAISGDTFTSNNTNGMSNSGGVETRPKNTAVNFFIKVNKSCNFN